MKLNKSILLIFLLFIVFSISVLPGQVGAEGSVNQRIFDEADLLTADEISTLELLSEKHSTLHETDFIILTVNKNLDLDGLKRYVQDMYDEKGYGYDQKHGNAAIIAVDIGSRELYMAGFYKAERYLDDDNVELILDYIVPALGENDFASAFEGFIEETSEIIGDGSNRDAELNSIELGPQYYIKSDKQRVIDGAGVLSEKEIGKLEKLAKRYSEPYEVDIIVVTLDGGLSSQQIGMYLEKIYDENRLGFQGNNGDAYLFGIDVSNKYVRAREFTDQAGGFTSFPDEDGVLNAAGAYLAKDNYYKGFKKVIEKTSTYLDHKAGLDPNSLILKSYFQLLIGLIIAAIVVFSLAYNSGGKVTTNQRTYRDDRTTRVLDGYDNYLRTTVTKVRKPRNEGSGGGGGGGGFSGGGRTSGGHSHSGGGRSF